MAYNAVVLRIMIASPGDVAEERDIARRLIHEWNDIHSQSSGIVLDAVGWDTHAIPEQGGRPQELINNSVLDTCDVLIGIFWTRLGTPTGIAPSGTVEEIERHVEAGKLAMIYFSDRAIEPDKLDDKQYQGVKAAKIMLRENGLADSYKELDDFETKLRRHLHTSVVSNDYIKNLLVSVKGVESADALLTKLLATTVVATTSNYADPDKSYNTLGISEFAARVLKMASSSEHGNITRMSLLGGTSIQIGGQSHSGLTGRELAKYDSALAELISVGYIELIGNAGIYQLTHKGWQVSDYITLTGP